MKKTLWVVAALLAACATVQPQPAQEPKPAGPPPLIDREVLFGDPEIAGGELSPDGQFVLFRKAYKDVLNIWVKKTSEPFSAARPITADTKRPIPFAMWSRDSKLVLFPQDQGGNENYHLYAVDPAATADPATGVPPARDLTPYENVRAIAFDLPKKDPAHILVGLNDRDPQYYDAYRIELATGKRELLFKNDQNVGAWLVDLDGNLRIATRETADGGDELLALEGGKLRPLYTCTFEESCYPVRFHKDGKRFYLITNKGDRDLAELVLFDPSTGKEELVDRDPEGQVDIENAEFSEVTDELVATSYVGDRLRIYPKEKDFARVLSAVRKALPEGDLYFTSSTADEKLRLVAVTSDVDPGATYVYDDATRKAELLYRPYPNLPTAQLAPMKPVRYEARDGLTIPAYLTLPRGTDGKNLPAVMLVHGGPWGRDSWGYDPLAQFLANRGYAVLQPNFRSSAGYGKKFLNLGNGQWGTGTMQHDVSDGAAWLVKQGIADPKRIAIAGGSYGGYATLAGVAFTPKLYAAGVDICGPSNIITLLHSIPPYWASTKKSMFKRVGDPDDPKDIPRLQAQSPLSAAKDIEAPLLVVQGKNDPRVKKAEADQIVIALRDLGRKVDYLVAEDEGHGFRGRENRIAMYAEMERFLAETLHGRYQESMPEPIAKKLAALRVDPATVMLAKKSEAPAKVEMPAFDGKALKPFTVKYKQTVEMGGRTFAMALTGTLKEEKKKGEKPAWFFVESATGDMGKAETSLWLDRDTLLPVRLSAKRGPATIELQIVEGSVKGELVAGPQKIPVDVKVDGPVLLGEAAPMLALASLKLEPGFKAYLRTFDLMSRKVEVDRFEVKGIEKVAAAGKQLDAYRLELANVEDEAISGVVWIEVAAPHRVLRSEMRAPTPGGAMKAVLELVE